MEALEIGLIAAMGCILFLSLFGNFILLIVVHGQLPYQAVRNYSYLILNLAISDILLASSCIPFDIVQRLKSPVFPFGETMCKLLWPFQTVCSMASIFTVGALSYQRYRLVARPLNGKLSRRRFFIMLASIWLLPVFLAGLPYSFVLRFDENKTCTEEWIPATEQARMKLSFTTYLFIIQYVLPLGLIVWCNVKAILELKRYLKYRRRTSIICALSIEHHENTVKMLTVIMTVFALFWLPGQVMQFLLEFERENEFILNYGADIGYLFAFTNCVMNPLIFAYFTRCHKNFPRQFRKLTSSSSINPVASLARRSNSLPNAQRRGSVPGNPKHTPLAKSLKRPSLPTILQSEGITDAQRKDILAAGRNKDCLTTIKNGSILSQKKMLPVLTEISSTDSIPPPKQKLPMLCEVPDPIPPTQDGVLSQAIQNGDPQLRTQKRSSFPGKRLFFSIEQQDDPLSITQNNNLVSNSQQNLQLKTVHISTQKLPQTEKRSSISIMTKRDSHPGTPRDSFRGMQTEKHGDVDAGNRLMKNFLEIMKTMKEDVLTKYLDATPETVLN